MKTKDRIKEEIGLNKLLMAIMSAITSSLVGWLVNSDVKIISPAFVVVFLAKSLFLGITFYLFIEIINKFEELDYD